MRSVLWTCLLLSVVSGCAARRRVKGPDFEIWDFRYGRIEAAEPEWIAKAEAEGILDNRDLGCRVVKRGTPLRFPFQGGFARYGFTFDYKISRPDVPVELYVVYPDRYSPTTIGPIRQRGTQRYRLRGTWGRFCVWESGTQEVQFPGRYWYRLTVGGVHVKDWYVDLLNGDATLPEGSHTKSVLDEPEIAPPPPPAPAVSAGHWLPGR
jgi:hypothetical protein